MSNIDNVFSGAIPALYETHLVPLIFEPYAADLKHRIAPMPVSRILEIAAGTGVLTRALATMPNPCAAAVATDLNQAMLDEAATAGTARPVHWLPADAMALPFPDREFDAVVCQFGAMFFPDKSRAFSEARRVLKPGGAFRGWQDSGLRRGDRKMRPGNPEMRAHHMAFLRGSFLKQVMATTDRSEILRENRVLPYTEKLLPGNTETTCRPPIAASEYRTRHPT